MHSDPLYWLHSLIITCREGEKDEDESQDDEGNNDDNDGEEGEDQENSDSKDDEFKDSEGNIDWEAKARAQEEALKKERRFRRKAEREARQLKKKSKPAGKAVKDDTDDNDDDDDEDKGPKEDLKLKRKLERQTSRSQKLAEGLLKRDLNDAIAKVARDMGFIDPSDAQTEAIRKEIDYEQDRDDPTEIEIDMETVKEAVQELADDKPHLVDKDRQKSKVKSGSKMRRKGSNEDDDKARQQKLLEDYPSLRA